MSIIYQIETKDKNMKLLSMMVVVFFSSCAYLQGPGPEDSNNSFKISDTIPKKDQQNFQSSDNNIIVSFNKAINPSSVTGTSSSTCSGTLQVSSDNFNTCYKMLVTFPLSNVVIATMYHYDGSAWVKGFVPNKTYQVKISGEVKSSEGESLPAYNFSFNTAFNPNFYGNQSLKYWLDAGFGVLKDYDTPNNTAYYASSGELTYIWINRANPSADINSFQTDTAKRPIYKATSAYLNNKPAIVFDGTDDFLLMPDLMATSNTTLFLVTVPYAYNTTLINALGSAGNEFLIATDAANYYGKFSAGTAPASFSNIGGGPASLNQAVILTLEIKPASGTDKTFQIITNGNAGLLQTVNSFGDTNWQGGSVANLLMGAKEDSTIYPYKGEIAELIYYGEAISVTDRQAIECYLGKKYNIVVSHTCN